MANVVVEGLALPQYPHVVFARTPLVLALCQLQFTPILSVEDAGFVAPFQSVLKSEYPIATEGNQHNVQVTVEHGKPRLTEETGKLWRFTDPHDDWTVVLTSRFLTLETRAYDQFEHYLDRLDRALEALMTHIEPTVLTRVGLRYVNEIRLEGRDLAWAIRPELLGPLAVPGIGNDVERSLQQLVLGAEGGERITVHHGLFPSGTAVQPRPGTQPPVDPFYLLDFDVSQEFPSGDAVALDPSRVVGLAGRFHGTIYQLFRWSITGEYTATLGVSTR